jgi:hypothetical protein
MRVFRDSMMSAEERKALYMVLDKVCTLAHTEMEVEEGQAEKVDKREIL